MPTTRRVAALGCYIVASTLLVVTLRVGPDPGGGGVVQHQRLFEKFQATEPFVGVVVEKYQATKPLRIAYDPVMCSMDGAYVKAALRMDAVPRGWPIILITDGQNTQKAGKLRKNWGAVETHATAYADLVLAVRSAYFIGNPASSFSANVVMIRRALGAAPTSTNLRVMDFPRPGSYNEQFA